MSKSNDRKTYTLLSNESNSFALQNQGVQLLSVYQTNSDYCVDLYGSLKQKAKEIFAKNDFLRGSLKKQKGKTVLEVDPEKLDRAKFVEEHKVDPDLFQKDVDYSKKCVILRPYNVGKAADILKENGKKDTLPLAKVFILRDTEDISAATRIAILLSINHVIADGRTVYNIFSMFDSDAPVRTLDRNSIEYNEDICKNTSMGGKNGRNLMINTLGEVVPLLKKSWYRSGKPQYKNKQWNFLVNNEEIEKVKKIYNTGDQFVSTNDVLNSHFYMKNPKADFVQMAVDIRTRAPVLKKNVDLAGNYIYLLYLRRADYETPLGIREKLNNIINKPGGVQARPTDKELMAYGGGVSTNWATFYKSVKISGLELEYQVPFFDESALDMRIFGIQLSWEDTIIIFKCNDKDLGVYILSGSSRIHEEDLLSDPMFGEKIL